MILAGNIAYAGIPLLLFFGGAGPETKVSAQDETKFRTVTGLVDRC